MHTMETALVRLIFAQDGDDLRIGIIVRNILRAFISNTVERGLRRVPIAVALAIKISRSFGQFP
jgi:hypothetical protein